MWVESEMRHDNDLPRKMAAVETRKIRSEYWRVKEG